MIISFTREITVPNIPVVPLVYLSDAAPGSLSFDSENLLSDPSLSGLEDEGYLVE